MIMQLETNGDEFLEFYARVGRLAERCGDDAELRARLSGDAGADELRKLGIDPPSGVEARIVADTEETMHVVLPLDPNAMLSDESLSRVSAGAAGDTVSTAGCVGTGGSFACSTVPSTVSSGGTVSSAGTANINS